MPWLSPFNLAQVLINNPLMVAPMAGVTDRPFRQLCKRLGAGYAVSEMVSSNPELMNTPKTQWRLDHTGETQPIVVQIAGTQANQMALAALTNIDRGAQVIDINMGCPSKKVCNQWAGSALMQNEPLALKIIEAVVSACLPHQVPVTLKMRTGWHESQRNALRLAKAAQLAGVAMVTVHGRTRNQGYKGQAEHNTLAQVKAALSIPVVVNGDIDSPQKALTVLQQTNADALMVGRAAQGRPWIFQEIQHYLQTGQILPPPTTLQVKDWLLEHLEDHYSLYGARTGMLTARKHIAWAVRGLPEGLSFCQHMNSLQSCEAQIQNLSQWMDRLAQTHELFISPTPL